MFSKVIIYKAANLDSLNGANLHEKLEPHQFLACGASQESSIGFVPPRGQEHGSLAEIVDGQIILKLQREIKKVPGDLVKRETEKQCEEIERQTGRKPGKKEKREIKEDAWMQLLPNALPIRSAVLIWIDQKNNLLVLEAASQNKADDTITALLKVFSELQISRVQTQLSAQTGMAGWLLAETPDDWPTNLSVERECVLKSSGEDGAVVKFSKHHLANEEVKKHVLEGKLPTSLALSWDGRVAFVLHDSLHLKKVRFLDGIVSDKAADKSEDRFDADVVLATAEIRPIILGLIEALGGEIPATSA